MQRIASTVDALTLPNAVAAVSHRLAPTPPGEDQIAFCGGMIGGSTRWGKAARATTKLPNGPLAAKMGWTSGQESARFLHFSFSNGRRNSKSLGLSRGSREPVGSPVTYEARGDIAANFPALFLIYIQSDGMVQYTVVPVRATLTSIDLHSPRLFSQFLISLSVRLPLLPETPLVSWHAEISAMPVGRKTSIINHPIMPSPT